MTRDLTSGSPLKVIALFTLPPRQSQPALATQRRSPCMSRAPKYWAMGMANPLHTPMTKPRIR